MVEVDVRTLLLIWVLLSRLEYLRPGEETAYVSLTNQGDLGRKNNSLLFELCLPFKKDREVCLAIMVAFSQTEIRVKVGNIPLSIFITLVLY